MSRSDEKVLESLHREIAEVLLRKIKEGEATASDLNVARQFLKDNSITANPGSDPLKDLTDELDRIPDFDYPKNQAQ